MERRRFSRGFTLIEIMIVVAIVGVLAALAIPTFMKHSKKTKASEAKLQIERLYNGAKIYFETHNRFVDVPGGPTPAAIGACGGGNPGRHAVNFAQWNATPWSELGFQMNDPHIYSYEYQPTATTFSAIAIGDVDCDNIRSSFTMTARSAGGEFEGGELTSANPSE